MIQSDPNGVEVFVEQVAVHVERHRRGRLRARAPVAAVGILAAKQRLWCQACAEYNKMGNAQPYTPRTAAPKNGKGSKNEPSEASTLLGVVMIAAAVAGLTAWAVSAHAWWWLIVLVPALLFVLLGLAGMILELMPKRRRCRLRSKSEQVNPVEK